MTDHYATLGVAKNATQDEIKRAFRKLASHHHPDKGGDTAEFQKIQAAYDTLGDADKRAAYDNPSPFAGFSQNAQGTHFDFNDIFSMFGARFQHPQPQRSHARMSLWITLEDVANPGPRTVGIGTASGTQAIEVQIPNGIEDGDNVQFPGLAPGGQDLVITFRVHPNSNWQRNGSHVTTQTTVSFWDLVAGGTVTLADLQGSKLEIAIPPRTQPGTLLRARGRGLPDRNGNRGDMMIRMQGRIPPQISEELMTAIRNEMAQ